MIHRLILVETDGAALERTAAVVREAEDFELAASFNRIGAALGQSSVFQPDVFLIDVDDPDALAAIPAFLSTFHDVPVLCMMEHWNSAVAEQCLKAGAIGSMLKPLRGEEISEALNAFTRRGQPKPPKIIAFFSPKGRSGKTTVVANLAISLARRGGEAVGVIDADLQFGDLPIFFDAEPVSTIIEAARDIRLLSPITLSPYFMTLADGLHLLSSPKRPELAELVDQESLLEIIRMAGSLYRYVLIDLPSGVSPLVMGVCEIADIIFLTGMIGSGFETQHMRRALGMFDGWAALGKKLNVVFSRVDPYTDEERRRLSKAIDFPIEAILPNEYLLISLANSGKMPDGIDFSSTIARKFDRMALELLDDAPRGGGVRK